MVLSVKINRWVIFVVSNELGDLEIFDPKVIEWDVIRLKPNAVFGIEPLHIQIQIAVEVEFLRSLQIQGLVEEVPVKIREALRCLGERGLGLPTPGIPDIFSVAFFQQPSSSRGFLLRSSWTIISRGFFLLSFFYFGSVFFNLFFCDREGLVNFAAEWAGDFPVIQVFFLLNNYSFSHESYFRWTRIRILPGGNVEVNGFSRVLLRLRGLRLLSRLMINGRVLRGRVMLERIRFLHSEKLLLLGVRRNC